MTIVITITIIGSMTVIGRRRSRRRSYNTNTDGNSNNKSQEKMISIETAIYHVFYTMHSILYVLYHRPDTMYSRL